MYAVVVFYFINGRLTIEEMPIRFLLLIPTFYAASPDTARPYCGEYLVPQVI